MTDAGNIHTEANLRQIFANMKPDRAQTIHECYYEAVQALEVPGRIAGTARPAGPLRFFDTQVMRDNDVKYPAQFDEVLKSAGASIKRNTPWSPNLQAHVERVIQTLKQEVLDHFVVVAERHLNYLIRETQAWYNKERLHSARDHLPPACEKPPDSQTSLKMSEVVCTTRLGGLLKSYTRRAA